MEKKLRYLAIISFFLIVIFFGLFKIVNFDFGWHLKTGEYIYSSKSIPTHDIFSYIAEGNRWVDSHWLFQLILYIFYAIGGTTGCIILRILLLLFTFGFLFFTYYKKEYFPISFLICIFALFMCFQRFLIRPEIFTFLFLSVFIYFTERFQRHPHLSLLIIPICQLMWVNMHGLHVLGIFFLLIYLLGDLFQELLSHYLSFIPKMDIREGEWKQKGILFLLTCIALLLNANGKDGILYPYKIFYELKTKPAVFSQVLELVSPFAMKYAVFPDPSIIYKIFIILSVLAFICQLKHIRLAHIFTYGAFLYLSTLAIRNVSLFAIVATPMTIRNFHGILVYIRKKIVTHLPISSGISILCIIFSILLCIFIANNRLYQRLQYLRSFGTGESDFYPAEAVDYLRDKKIAGNIYNSSEIGGYLIWKMYPEKQVAFDGRWEVYQGLLENIQKVRSPLYFAKLTAKYNIRAIILHKRSGEMRVMAPWLRTSRFWSLTKNTSNAVVYERFFGS